MAGASRPGLIGAAPLDTLPWQPIVLSASHRDRISLKSAWIRAKKIQERYAARLRKVARHIDDIVKGFDAATLQGQVFIQAHLIAYRDALRPWAEAAADTFVKEVSAADDKAWKRLSAEIGRGVAKEVASAPMEAVFREVKAEQVRLITSLPHDASERVADRVRNGLAKGLRAEQVAKEIYETGAVTKSRAALIARTETGRAATAFQSSRAQHAGSQTFRWLTSQDADVRLSHRKLNGSIHRWDAPPMCDAPAIHALPGCTFNCRCIAIPIFDD